MGFIALNYKLLYHVCVRLSIWPMPFLKRRNRKDGEPLLPAGDLPAFRRAAAPRKPKTPAGVLILRQALCPFYSAILRYLQFRFLPETGHRFPARGRKAARRRIAAVSPRGAHFSTAASAPDSYAAASSSAAVRFSPAARTDSYETTKAITPPISVSGGSKCTGSSKPRPTQRPRSSGNCAG